MARDTLTSEWIVHTAIELLDAEGLDGLNMRSLGERLGSAATAVYWHVKSKENLVQLAGNEVWNEIELPDLHATDWRTAGIAMAKGLHAMLTQHPWLVRAMGTHMFQGSGKARHDDHCLAIYEMAGFVGAEADRAMTTVFMFVLGGALGESAAVTLRRHLRHDGRDPEELMRESIARQTEIAAQFPRLRARLESAQHSEYFGTPDQSFDFGLDTIFDGLERQLGLGRTSMTSPSTRPSG